MRAGVVARSRGLGIAAATLVAFHLVSTATLAIVMVELRGRHSEERQMTELMRDLAISISICGRLLPRPTTSL